MLKIQGASILPPTLKFRALLTKYYGTLKFFVSTQVSLFTCLFGIPPSLKRVALTSGQHLSSSLPLSGADCRLLASRSSSAFAGLVFCCLGPGATRGGIDIGLRRAGVMGERRNYNIRVPDG